MNLEETKKIIENKIEAEALTRNVRSQKKSYIHEKQNVREGFKETFQPLIATQEAVKTIIDTQQNKLIKQLQENQLALTEGLEGNRLAITQGFDKMDEVKRWDLSQLPGYEAIERPEEPEEEPEEPEEDILKKIKNLQKLMSKKIVLMNKLAAETETKFKDGNIEEANKLQKEAEHQSKSIENLKRKLKLSYQSLDEEFEEETEEVSVKKPNITTVTYGKDQMDKYLNKKETVDLLNFYGLKRPSEYKDKSLEEFQKAFDKGMDETANLKKSIKNVAYYKRDSLTGF